jgi:hypothetical protein
VQAGRLSVIELRVHFARRIGRRLFLGARDATARRRLIFEFDTKREAAAHLHRIVDWISRGTTLAYVHGSGECALIETEELLARAWPPSEKHLD